MVDIENSFMCSKVRLIDSYNVYSVVFSPNGEYLASGSGGEIGIWRVSSGERIKTLTGHSSSINSVVFSPNGEYLASGSGREIGVWRVLSRERIKTLTGH